MYCYLIVGLWLTMSCYAASFEEIALWQMKLKEEECALWSEYHKQCNAVQIAFEAWRTASYNSPEDVSSALLLQQEQFKQRVIAEQLSICGKRLDAYALPDKRLLIAAQLLE